MTKLIEVNTLLDAMEDGICYTAVGAGEKARVVNLLVNIRDIIQNQPTVEAEPVRRGKWIHKWSGDGSTWIEQRCSECCVVLEEEPIDYNYCPNCGAKMVERNEE